jgi:hypothetical protein
MTKVYVLEYSCPFDGNTSVTIWDNENDAYKQAAHDIQCTIKDRWDMSNETEREDAHEINERIKAGAFKSAVIYFNECDVNDRDTNESWHVRCEYTMVNASDPQVFADDYFEDNEHTCDENCDDGKVESEDVYQATESGATCRGPCGGYNEYAYADRRDGTFVCYACKTMGQTFGA